MLLKKKHSRNIFCQGCINFDEWNFWIYLLTGFWNVEILIRKKYCLFIKTSFRTDKGNYWCNIGTTVLYHICVTYLLLKVKQWKSDKIWFFFSFFAYIITPRFYNLYRVCEMDLPYIPFQHIYSVYLYQAEVLFEFLIIEFRIPDVLRRSKTFNTKS